MQIRVLVLGDDTIAIPRDLEEGQGVEVVLTCETRDDIWHRGGFYYVSEGGLQLAREASPEKYDAVVVGNNLETGVVKARELPEVMRDRTMIAWNRYEPGIERSYAAMGFTRFGQRYSHGDDTTFAIKDFLREVVAEITATK